MSSRTTSRNVPVRWPDGDDDGGGSSDEPGVATAVGDAAAGWVLSPGLGEGDAEERTVGSAVAIEAEALGAPLAMGCMGAVVGVTALVHAKEHAATPSRTAVTRAPRSMVRSARCQGAGLGLREPGAGSGAASDPKTAASSNAAE